jgi:UDP-hydrolysing UDP-N-acetyl-D-glucosamine 2-epimerase
MGEEPWRVSVTGAPSLDNVKELVLHSRDQLEHRFHMDLAQPTLLVTYHPVSLEYEKTGQQMEELLSALEEVALNVVFTYPNADTYGRKIIRKINEFARANDRCTVIVNAGTETYCSLMHHTIAVVGNSSSGIIEAASFEKPVVNIGNRQRGRVSGKNVLHVNCVKEEIKEAIRKAVSAEFCSGLKGMVNPYGDGSSCRRIVKILKSVVLDEQLISKAFYDVNFTCG